MRYGLYSGIFLILISISLIISFFIDFIPVILHQSTEFVNIKYYLFNSIYNFIIILLALFSGVMLVMSKKWGRSISLFVSAGLFSVFLYSFISNWERIINNLYLHPIILFFLVIVLSLTSFIFLIVSMIHPNPESK